MKNSAYGRGCVQAALNISGRIPSYYLLENINLINNKAE